jgi:hypothetical protein
MIIGFERTFRFFFQRYKLKSTALFFGGISLVLIGWPLTGMIIEFYGFFLLFGFVCFVFKKKQIFNFKLNFLAVLFQLPSISFDVCQL